MDEKRSYQQMNDINPAYQNQNPPPYNGEHGPTGGAPPPVDAIVTTTTTMALPPGIPVIPHPVGPKSAEMICPHCRCHIKTRIDHRSTAKTHIACLLLACTPCCCLPYCMDSCRNTNHFCPMCRAYLGTYAS